jgi:hypothetical protein
MMEEDGGRTTSGVPHGGREGGVTCRGHLVERHLLEVKILEDIMVV